MPTGYTAPIYEGKDITFPEFAMQCARAFGALITMRDDPADAPIPDEFTPAPYYQQNLDRARTRLAELEGWTDEQWAAKAQRDYEESIRSAAAANARNIAMRERYEAMLAQVEAWEPPTPDHEELKQFMASQIRDSIEHDCYAVDAPEQMSAEDYKARQVADARRDVSYYERAAAEEAERARGRTEWLRALRASLPEPSRA
jgi:hypothetical protein